MIKSEKFYLSKDYEDSKNFEEEAYKFLKTKFKEVYWLSKDKPNSTYDFLVVTEKGKRLYGDAKITKKNTKIIARYSQRGSDFFIIKRKDDKYPRLIMPDKFYESINFENSVIIRAFPETKNLIYKFRKKELLETGEMPSYSVALKKMLYNIPLNLIE